MRDAENGRKELLEHRGFNHRNIVKIIEAFEEEKTNYCIVMELCDGKPKFFID